MRPVRAKTRPGLRRFSRPAAARRPVQPSETGGVRGGPWLVEPVVPRVAGCRVPSVIEARPPHHARLPGPSACLKAVLRIPGRV